MELKKMDLGFCNFPSAAWASRQWTERSCLRQHVLCRSKRDQHDNKSDSFLRQGIHAHLKAIFDHQDASPLRNKADDDNALGCTISSTQPNECFVFGDKTDSTDSHTDSVRLGVQPQRSPQEQIDFESTLPPTPPYLNKSRWVEDTWEEVSASCKH